jgi:hypothetical protein
MIGFRTSRAVVIGIDAYQNGIPPLRTAVNDARRVADVLETDFEYSVHLLTVEVTLERLRTLFGEILPREVEADDRLLVYFAGHGIALDGDDGPAGYLVPQDARREDRGTFLPMTELSACLDRLPCRHLLLVLDCCFAGAFRWSSTRDLGALPEVIHRERFDRYIRDPAWQVITSAACDQKALDVLSGEAIGLRGRDPNQAGHSPFAAALLRALQGEADLVPRPRNGRPGGDGVITATELYLYLRECVEVGAEADGHRQTPGLWPLKRHDKGEFIHLVPGHELNLPPAPELNEANNPYRGLQSYDEEHAPLFFGRSKFVATLAERVRAQSLTIVLGASGTGKSSVVKAGLLPLLRSCEPDAWQILPPLRPGKSPLAALAALSLEGEPGDPDAIAGRLEAARSDPEALARRVAAWAAAPTAETSPSARLLIVVDQFEELLTICWDAAERERFLVQLDRAMAACPDRLRVVLTLRSDFEPQFGQSPLQEEWLAARVVVPAMTLDEYREVIEGPALVKVLYFQGKVSSQAFIDRLIGDVANTPGALPLLSFCLSELYRSYLERRGDDRCLREDDYEALCGVGGSLRNRVDKIYHGLPDDAHRETMGRVMLRMVSVEGGELARRRVPSEEFVYEDPEENRRVQEILRRLTEARLVVEGKEVDSEPFVEPAHDELIRGWDILLRWSRDEAESLQLRRRLTPASIAWSRRHGGLWLADPRLGILKQVLQNRGNWLNRVEVRFVKRSLAVRRQIALGSLTAVGLAFLVISTLGLYVNSQRHTVVQERNNALQRLAQSYLRWARLNSLQGRADVSVHYYWRALNALPSDDPLNLPLREYIATSAKFALPRPVVIYGRMVNPANPLDAFAPITRDDWQWPMQNAEPRKPDFTSLGQKNRFKLMSISPDARSVVAVLADTQPKAGKDSPGPQPSHRAQIWDVASGAPRGQPLQHDGAILSVSFSEDGNTVITSGEDKTARIWNAEIGLSLGPPLVHKGPVFAAALHARNGIVMTTSSQMRGVRHVIVQLWDVKSGKATTISDVVRAFPSGPGDIKSVALSPDGRMAIHGGLGGAILYDVETRSSLGYLREQDFNDLEHMNLIRPVPVVSAVGINPAASVVIINTPGGASLWRTRPIQRFGEELVTRRPFYAFAFSLDGKTLATADEVGRMQLWDAETGVPRCEPFTDKDRVLALLFSPDGRTVIAGTVAGRICRWVIPPAAANDKERLRLSLEYRSGLTEDERTGSVRVLSVRERVKILEQLQKLGGLADVSDPLQQVPGLSTERLNAIEQLRKKLGGAADVGN